MISKINLLVDFDGVICEEPHNFPEIGAIRTDAKKYLDLLYNNENFTLTLHTCRSDKAFDMAKEFLEKEGIKFHYYNEHPQHILEKYGKIKENASRKLSGIFIDNQSLEHAVNGLENMIEWRLIYQMALKLIKNEY